MPRSEPAADADARSASRGTLPFFALTFAITGLLQLPAVLAQQGVLAGPVERLLPVAGLGTFGPTIAALLLARFHKQGGGVRALLSPLRLRGVGIAWPIVALLLPGTLLVVGLATYALVTGADTGPWFYPPRDAQRFVALLLIPLAEEIGWRGFALPRLQARYGALVASVLLGVVWALWHVPMFVLASVPLSLLPTMVVFFSAGSVVFSWLWNRSGRSLFVAVLAHAGAHLSNSHLPLPANVVPLLAHTGAYVALAVGLALLDRETFGRRRSRSEWK